MRARHTAHLLAAPLLALLLLAAAETDAQTPSDAAAPEPALEETEPSLAEVVGLAGEAESQLRQIEAGLAPDPRLVDVAARLPEYLERLDERAEAALERIEQAAQLRQFTDIEKAWLAEQETLERWRADATGRALAIRDALAQVDELIAVWERIQQAARGQAAPGSVTDRIGRTLERTRTTREKLTIGRGEVLELQAALAGGLAPVADVLEETKRAQQAVRGGLLGIDSLPIWTVLQRRREFQSTLEMALKSIEHDVVVTRDFARDGVRSSWDTW